MENRRSVQVSSFVGLEAFEGVQRWNSILTRRTPTVSFVASSRARNTGSHSSARWFSLHIDSNRPQNALSSSGKLRNEDRHRDNRSGQWYATEQSGPIHRTPARSYPRTMETESSRGRYPIDLQQTIKDTPHSAWQSSLLGVCFIISSTPVSTCDGITFILHRLNESSMPVTFSTVSLPRQQVHHSQQESFEPIGIFRSNGDQCGYTVDDRQCFREHGQNSWIRLVNYARGS